MDDADPDPDAPQFDDLTPEEVRVLGCLVEKEATVPDSYPLTLNSLRTACNQSTSRDPVVSYDERTVERALASLRSRSLTRTVHSTSNRATKYRHVVPEALGLDEGETAVLAVLMLRGEQTAGELKSRTERQHVFDAVDDVTAVLTSLAGRERPLTAQLERRPGQKDARWTHLLTPRSNDATPADATPADAATGGTGSADEAAAPANDDAYAAATAEFYDLLATAHWETFGLQLLDLLDGVDPDIGPIVDLGAGTGVGLPYLTAAVPGARVHAVEPSKAMRIALHARLATDAALREATTVDPRPLARAGLPDRAAALIASAVLGHLSDDERHRLWEYVASALSPGAPAVIELLPPGRAIEVPANRYRTRRVGQYTYEGWQAGTPIDDRTMAWTMTYRVLDGHDEVSTAEVAATWRCFTVDDVRDEIAPYGLTLTDHGDTVVIGR